MRRRLIVLCVALLPLAQVYAQLSKPYSSRWQTRIVFGTDIPIKKFLRGDVTDYLMEYDNNSGYMQFFNSSLFVSRHWGIDAGYQIQVANTGDREAGFQRRIETEYGDAYYVTAFISDYGEIQTRGNLGVVYRFESKRFMVYPRLSLGFTTFGTNDATAYLKEKNTNNIVELKYNAKGSSRAPFTLIPSVSLGYRVLNRFAVNVDIAGAYFRSNVSYTKQTQGLYAKILSTDNLSAKRSALALSVGFGIVFTLFEKDGR
jgi:hypothetical protein